MRHRVLTGVPTPFFLSYADLGDDYVVQDGDDELYEEDEVHTQTP